MSCAFAAAYEAVNCMVQLRNLELNHSSGMSSELYGATTQSRTQSLIGHEQKIRLAAFLRRLRDLLFSLGGLVLADMIKADGFGVCAHSAVSPSFVSTDRVVLLPGLSNRPLELRVNSHRLKLPILLCFRFFCFSPVLLLIFSENLRSFLSSAILEGSHRPRSARLTP
jgi:hypothetical protein